LDAGTRGALFDADTQHLRIGLPPAAEPAQVRDAVQSWLQRQARRVFEERCQHYAERLGVRVTRLALSSAATRWGSASADGSIRLNWRLVHFALPVIDYVVAHELAHLREMNHSPAFWSVVRSVIPEYERSRSTLRDELLPVFD
jgi:predicted metal-dependent hydrolase